MQNLIVLLIVLAAVIYVGRRLYNSFRPGASSCGCGCSGCSNSGCSLPRNKDSRRKTP